MEYEYIFTIGCFDRLHKGHMKLLTTMKSRCKNLIVGIHNNESIKIIKNITNVQSLDIRKENLKEYATDIFDINDADPTNTIKEYINSHFASSTEPIVGYKKNMCFMRADDNETFPGKEYISTIMPIEFLNYTKGISSSMLRNFDKNNKKYNKQNKYEMHCKLIENISGAYKDNNIPHYIDCGTLLGCIRENDIIEKDTDVDVTIPISYWEKILNIDYNKFDLEISDSLYFNDWKHKPNISFITKTPQLRVCFKGVNIVTCDVYTCPAFPKLTTKIMNGVSYSIPQNPELYLSLLYGQDWKTPSNKHASSVFHRGDDLVNSEYKPYWDTDLYEIVPLEKLAPLYPPPPLSERKGYQIQGRPIPGRKIPMK